MDELTDGKQTENGITDRLERLALFTTATLCPPGAHAGRGGKNELLDPLLVSRTLHDLRNRIPERGDPVLLLIVYLLLAADNQFTRSSDRGMDVDPLTLALVRQDLAILEAVARQGAEKLFADFNRARGLPALSFGGVWSCPHKPDRILPGFERMLDLFAEKTPWPDRIGELGAWYREHGSGEQLYGLAYDLVLDPDGTGRLEIIEEIDLPGEDRFFGYEDQRAVVRANTGHFTGGRPAQDLLLYGDRGTGKSSTIRLMLHEFAASGLRLLRVKPDKKTILQAFRMVRGQRWRYLVFIDDISFEANDAGALEFRSLLQGDAAERPENTLFYVTSNRKNIVRAKVRDTGDYNTAISNEDEQETLALSDRFGIKVWFPTPSQEEFLAIVRGLARQHGITLADGELERRALVWERWHNVRSPRTAEQFVRNLVAETAAGTGATT